MFSMLLDLGGRASKKMMVLGWREMSDLEGN